MADYKEYDVEVKGGKIRISEHEPAGCSTYIYIVLTAIILIIVVSSIIDKASSPKDYKIKKGQTEYAIGGIELVCFDQWDTRKTINSSYDYILFWAERTGTKNLNGKFKRLTGNIQLPKASGKTVFAYWDDCPLPVGASTESISLFASDESKAAVEERMVNKIKQELLTVARTQNLFTVKIYGDGRLLYTSPIMIEQNSPVSFNIDVTGVQQVEFRWSCAYAIYGDAYGEANIAVYDLCGHTD